MIDNEKALKNFEDILKTVDWFYEYAEGKQYFSGSQKMAIAKRMLSELTKNSETEILSIDLWNKYAPDSEKIKLNIEKI